MGISLHDQLKSVLPHDRDDTVSHSWEKRKAVHSRVQETQRHNATAEIASAGQRRADLDK